MTSSRRETYTEACGKANGVPQVIIWSADMIPMHMLDSSFDRIRCLDSENTKSEAVQFPSVDPQPSQQLQQSQQSRSQGEASIATE